ncbi:hypothetical protein Hypma_009126 [Hypsizygus marmoreus]|uniref:Uncharacterized protein n=1 Tax=Hypsizygus marmoreus TaxID=39966 RepID=A0A369JM68_HYPMA|nr:hypothetical protein Hypma_009126 [Hypsizygus marmoreus]
MSAIVSLLLVSGFLEDADFKRERRSSVVKELAFNAPNVDVQSNFFGLQVCHAEDTTSLAMNRFCQLQRPH